MSFELPSKPDTAIADTDVFVKANARGDAPKTVTLTLLKSSIAAAAGHILADGSTELTANWDAGSFDITAEQLHSDIVTGTAPLTVASTTVVANLNADTVDGVEAAAILQPNGSVPMTAATAFNTDNIAEVTAGAGTTFDNDVTRAAGATDWSRRNRVVICDEDFFLAAGSTLPAERVPWTKTIVGNGPPTGDYANDALNGSYVFTNESTDQLQSVTLSFGDQLVVDPSKNPVIEARLKIAPPGANFTADERFVFGLAAARNATLDTNAEHAWFRIEGADLKIYVEADDGTNNTDDQDSTITYTKDTYTTFRIDMSDITDIKFYIDGVEQGGAAVSAAALDNTMKLQPYFEIQRDAGSEVNVITIDYVYCEQDRV